MHDPSSSSFAVPPRHPTPDKQTESETHAQAPVPEAASIPTWSGTVAYSPGEVVWSEGSYWRCETEPFRAAGAPPGRQLHVWTPMSSVLPAGSSAHQVQQPPPWSPPAGPSKPHPPPDADEGGTDRKSSNSGPSGSTSGPSGSSKAGIIAPVPLSASNMQSHDALFRQGSAESHDSDSSPDSQTTVTARHPQPQGQPQGQSKSAPEAESASSRSMLPGVGMSTAQFFTAKADESLRFLTARQEVGKARDPGQWEEELKGKRVWRIGGLGMWAHDLDPEVEARKAEVWREWSGAKGKGKQAWLQAAQDRTTFYTHTRGIKPLVIWRLVQPGTPYVFPPDALQIGHEGSGQPLFSARAWHEGGLHLGKAGPHLNRGCSISYGSAEIQTDTFEVLCSAGPDPALLKWMCFNHGEETRVEGWQPVEGGRERDGQSLFVAKGEWEGGQHPGKCRSGEDYAHIGWGGGEVWIRPFYVLAYASTTRR